MKKVRCALGIDIDQATLYATFSHDGFQLPGDVVQAVVSGGGYLDGLLHGKHSQCNETQ